jgi:hypothetical protein
LKNYNAGSPENAGFARIIASLEHHLAELDQLGVHIAAAYLDSAIQHLRTEQARLAAGNSA